MAIKYVREGIILIYRQFVSNGIVVVIFQMHVSYVVFIHVSYRCLKYNPSDCRREIL